MRTVQGHHQAIALWQRQLAGRQACEHGVATCGLAGHLLLPVGLNR
jgi:hypothetical protein